MLTVGELLELALDGDDKVAIYKMESECEEVMIIDDAIEKYGDCEVWSWDSFISANYLTINIGA